MERIIDFFFEIGMLKRTPRSGWQFLGTGRESVAEHVFRTAMVAWTLARMDETADADRVVRMVLAHDLAEARTGDLNYMNQRYVTADDDRAFMDMARGTPLDGELHELRAELASQATREATLANDADQLDFLLSLKEQADAGNPSAREWAPFVVERLRTDVARTLARSVLERHSSAWWFDQDSTWWVNRGRG